MEDLGGCEELGPRVSQASPLSPPDSRPPGHIPYPAACRRHLGDQAGSGAVLAHAPWAAGQAGALRINWYWVLALALHAHEVSPGIEPQLTGRLQRPH